MIETPNPEIDVDALMAEIRAEVAQGRAEGGQAPLPERPAPHWFRAVDQLGVAEQHAAVGLEVPPFTRYRGLKRRLARLAARGVLFFGEVVTAPQRVFNVSSLAVLRELVDRVQRLEREVESLRAAVPGRPAASDAGKGERRA